MNGRRGHFASPSSAPEGRVVKTRFGIREPETKKQTKDQSIFTYSEPGRGPNGESSN